jgi:3-methyladenine DNA glycosylase AlkD
MSKRKAEFSPGAAKVAQLLESRVVADKAPAQQRFFKTGPGEYAEGDIFIGVSVPDQRKIAKECLPFINLEDIPALLKSPVHEHRLTGLFLLIGRYQKARGNPDLQEAVVQMYLDHLDWVNNWDLVDSSAHKILGDWLLDKDRSLLYTLARSAHLWRQRVAIIATAAFIPKEDLEDTFRLSEILLNHPHDLIHKAVGWMLREAGKVNIDAEKRFLAQYAARMPRTMLRYAIERFPEADRKYYLGKGR